MRARVQLGVVAIVLGMAQGAAAVTGGRGRLVEEPLEVATPQATLSPVPADARPTAAVLPGASGTWRAIELLRRTVAPGEKRRLQFPTGHDFGGSPLDIPVLVVRGERPGPTLCLTAGVHGDELNGVEIVRHVFEHAEPRGLEGMLVGVPIVNMHGFRRGSRYLPDRRDLNRYFPGKPAGSTASRTAHVLFVEVVRFCDALVDLHTGSLERTNLPQIRAELSRGRTRELALAFGVGVVLEGDGPAGSLRGAAVDAGIAAIVYEAGQPLRFEDEEIARGVEGVRNVMAHLGMVHGSNRSRPAPVVFRRTRWVRTGSGGIFRTDRRLGDQVTAGEVLGTVTDPITNERSRIVAPVAGRLIGMAIPQVVLPGFAAFHLGTDEEGA
jgi:predicted deacylase